MTLMQHLTLAFLLVASFSLQDDPAKLVDQLGSDDLELRDAAQAKLVTLGAGALVALEKGAKSDIDEIKSRCNHILSGFNYKNRAFVLTFSTLGDVGVARLTKELAARTDVEERRYIIEALGLSKAEKAFALIKAEAGSKDGETRRVAFEALGNFSTKEAVDFLLANTKEPDVRYRKAILVALGRTKSPAGIATIVAGLKDEPVKMACAEALTAAACDATADEIARGLDSDHAFTVQLCISQLGRLKSKKHAAAIGRHVAGADRTAAEALRALGRIGEGADLAKAALTRAPLVAAYAAEALWRMGDKSGLPVLYKMLEGDATSLAQERLRAMTGKDLGTDPAAWKAVLEK